MNWHPDDLVRNVRYKFKYTEYSGEETVVEGQFIEMDLDKKYSPRVDGRSVLFIWLRDRGKEQCYDVKRLKLIGAESRPSKKPRGSGS